MPTMLTLFEREIHELSRAALRLEKLIAGSDSIPGPIRYQQILKRLSEFQRTWQNHRGNPQKRVLTLSSMERELAPIIEDIDELGFSIEQQLKAVRTSSWPHSVHAGLCSLRFAASRTLALIYQQNARERATCASFIYRQNNPPAKTPRLVLSAPVSKVKTNLRVLK